MVNDDYQTYFFTPCIGSGKESNVFAISPEFAVKIPKWRLYGGRDNRELLRPELERQTLFYENGINVAKPEGILEVRIRHKWTWYGLKHGKRVGLVMERLYGINGSKTGGDLRERVKELFEAEVEKAKSLGHRPSSGIVNSVYVPSEDKVYLVDLSDWIMIPKPTPQPPSQ